MSDVASTDGLVVGSLKGGEEDMSGTDEVGKRLKPGERADVEQCCKVGTTEEVPDTTGTETAVVGQWESTGKDVMGGRVGVIVLVLKASDKGMLGLGAEEVQTGMEGGMEGGMAWTGGVQAELKEIPRTDGGEEPKEEFECDWAICSFERCRVGCVAGGCEMEDMRSGCRPCESMCESGTDGGSVARCRKAGLQGARQHKDAEGRGNDSTITSRAKRWTVGRHEDMEQRNNRVDTKRRRRETRGRSGGRKRSDDLYLSLIQALRKGLGEMDKKQAEKNWKIAFSRLTGG